MELSHRRRVCHVGRTHRLRVYDNLSALLNLAAVAGFAARAGSKGVHALHDFRREFALVLIRLFALSLLALMPARDFLDFGVLLLALLMEPSDESVDARLHLLARCLRLLVDCVKVILRLLFGLAQLLAIRRPLLRQQLRLLFDSLLFGVVVLAELLDLLRAQPTLGLDVLRSAFGVRLERLALCVLPLGHLPLHVDVEEVDERFHVLFEVQEVSGLQPLGAPRIVI
mmetsp:Transcript_13494/g.30302  ORF Transcript_13494/g.30302 Transcript_13494/m.30302 type:complete len:227 (+) Transcript_13494:40-720(+)